MIHTLVMHFAALEDPRCPGKITHKLIDILVIAVCAVVAEADTFEDIALYGRCKQDWLKGFLELPNGIPSHDTFRRVLMLIDPEAFERCFLAWVREVFRSETAVMAEQIAIDGKTVRRSFDRRRGRSPLHLVNAYATGRGLVLAQRATPDKRGELTVLPEILDGLALQGTLVSLDALACRRELAEAIVSRGGDYLITLKANQGRIYKEVRDWFAAHAFGRGGSLRPCFDAFDDSHGRLVRRRVFACPDAGGFATLKDWPGLRAVLASETIRGVNGREDHGRDSALRLKLEGVTGGPRGRDPPALGDRERAQLGARRHLRRGRQPGARAECGPEHGGASADCPRSCAGEPLAHGEPEGQAQVRRLG